jgi:hypothetical protein
MLIPRTHQRGGGDTMSPLATDGRTRAEGDVPSMSILVELTVRDDVHCR